MNANNGTCILGNSNVLSALVFETNLMTFPQLVHGSRVFFFLTSLLEYNCFTMNHLIFCELFLLKHLCGETSSPAVK